MLGRHFSIIECYLSLFDIELKKLYKFFHGNFDSDQ